MFNNSIKNRIYVFGTVFVLFASMLTGCGNSIPDMTEQQEQKVGEYAALVMLKYDANHRSRLVELLDYSIVDESALDEEIPVEEPEKPIEEPAQEPEKLPEPENPAEEIPIINVSGEIGDENVSIEEFLKLPEGVSLVYTGYSWGMSYPEDGAVDAYFTLDASEGKKILIVHYTMVNQSGADQYIDIFQSGCSFKAIAEGNTTKSALVTMLSDDMATFMDTIANGASTDLVLLFEEDKDAEESLSSLSLMVKDKDGKTTVVLE